jgi:type III pantothenate kinase
MANLLLALDAGNTDITIGVFDGSRLLSEHRVSHRTVDDPMAAVLAVVPASEVWRGAVLASVVPSLDAGLIDVCRRVTGLEPVIIDYRADLGIKVATAAPERVGADRLVNAAGTFHRYGGPLVVADVGTAITVCAVDAGGAYLGGAIAPGITMGRDALASRAEKLPKVPLEAPRSPIGHDTEAAMQVGLVLGFAGLLERLLLVTLSGLDEEPPPKVYLTGGQAALLSPHLNLAHQVVPGLTLASLRLLFDRAAN